MRALLAALLLLPAHALAFGVGSGGFGVKTSGAGSVAPEAPRCDFAVQLPGYSGGEFVCRVDAAPVTTTRDGTATCLDGHVATANRPCVSRAGLECFAAGTGGRTAGDVHTVSTAGWPASTFDIRLRVSRLSGAMPSSSAYVLDTTNAQTASGIYVYYSATGSLVFGWRSATTVDAFSVGGVGLAAEREVWLRYSGGTYSLWLDGVQAGSKTSAIAVVSHFATARLGGVVSGGIPLDGSIRLLRVSE